MKLINSILLSIMFLSLLTSCQNDRVLPSNDETVSSKQTKSDTERIVKIEKEFIDYFSDELELNGFESCSFNNGKYKKTDEFLPQSLVSKLELAKLDIDKNFEKVLKENLSEATFFPIAKKKIDDMYLLLYGLIYDNDYTFAREFRLLFYQEDRVVQNILFCASIADEGESTLCRKLQVFPNRIELIKLDSDNVDYLNIKEKETYYFKEQSTEEPIDTISNIKIDLPIDIAYKTNDIGNDSRAVTHHEIELMDSLGMNIFETATISTVGMFTIKENVIGRLQRVVDSNYSATVLSTLAGEQTIRQFLVQKYVKGESGFSTTIEKSLNMSRAEMFEIERNGVLELEVDHFDEFKITENGDIIATSQN